MKNLAGTTGQCIWALRHDLNLDQQIKACERRLQDNRKAEDNLVAAIERGLANEKLYTRIEELQDERIKIQIDLEALRKPRFGLSESQLVFFLLQYVKRENEPPEDFKRRIIKAFVTKVILYDDKLRVFYNLDEEKAPLEGCLYELEGSLLNQLSELRGSLVEIGPHYIIVETRIS